MCEIHDSINCFDLDFKEERKFKRIIEDHLSVESWHFIGKKTTNEYKYFYNIHEKLKKEINKIKENE